MRLKLIFLLLLLLLVSMFSVYAQYRVVKYVKGDSIATEYLDNFIHNGISDSNRLEVAYIWDAPDFDWILDVYVFENPADDTLLIVTVNYIFHPRNLISRCGTLLSIIEDTAELWGNWLGVNLGTEIYFTENSPDPVMELGYVIVDDLIDFINKSDTITRTEAWE